MSLQAYSNVTIEDVVVHGECCPSGRNSSLNLFVSGAIYVSQVDVAFNVLDLSVVSIYILLLRLVHLQSLIVTCICSFLQHSCGVLADMCMSSAKRR